MDDGSSDGTAAEALRGRGRRSCVSPRRPRGKGEALEGALDRVPPADVYLFVDADTARQRTEAVCASGRRCSAVIADVAVGRLPPPWREAASGSSNERRGGWSERPAASTATEPMSGQRACSRQRALALMRPAGAAVRCGDRDDDRRGTVGPSRGGDRRGRCRHRATGRDAGRVRPPGPPGPGHRRGGATVCRGRVTACRCSDRAGAARPGGAATATNYRGKPDGRVARNIVAFDRPS